MYFLSAAGQADLRVFSLVNIILHGTLDKLDTAQSDALQRGLESQLEEIDNERADGTIQVRSVVSHRNTIHFITSMPYSKASSLLGHLSDETDRSFVQRQLANLPFLGSFNPIITITGNLDDEHWKFTWDEIPSQGIVAGEHLQQLLQKLTCQGLLKALKNSNI